MSLLLLAVMATAVQNPAPAVRETASGITFSLPSGWTRRQLENQSVGLSPPGQDGQNFTVLILPGRPNDVAHAAAHDGVFATMTTGGRIEGGVRQSTVAGWRRSEARVVTAGRSVWTALYTIQADRKLEAVMVVAATEPLFRAYSPVVEQLIAGSTVGVAATPVTAARGGTSIHGLVIPYPSTWTRQVDPSGAVVLVPAQLQGVQQYFISVLPPSPQKGTHWESHRALLATVLAQIKWTEQPVTRDYPDGPGPFIRTSIAGRIATGGLQQIELYTAAHGGTIETVVGVNGIDRNVTDPVLRQVTFNDASTPPERPRIVEAFRRLDQQLYVNLQGGRPIAGSLQYERIWLRADGVADFSTTYPEGYAASTLPFKVDAGFLDGDYGRWEAEGDQVRITRRAGAEPVVYVRENGGLRNGNSRWEPMPRVDDLKLSGRWSIRSAPTETVSPYYDWIEFSPDGRFSSSGVLRRISSGIVDQPKPPDPASGTYRIRDWTIFFTFADGSTWSTDFSTLGQDPGSVAAILFGTTAYPRER
jgi:hypothetical protein